MADVDDGSIADNAGLLRRIRPDQIVDDENVGARRPSSAAFKDPSLSVDAEPLLAVNGLDWHFTLNGYQGYSLAAFAAASARANNLPVIAQPLKDNPAHVIVAGKKTQGVARQLAAAANWVHLEPKK